VARLDIVAGLQRRGAVDAPQLDPVDVRVEVVTERGATLLGPLALALRSPAAAMKR
jgi:hypothetical protein